MVEVEFILGVNLLCPGETLQSQFVLSRGVQHDSQIAVQGGRVGIDVDGLLEVVARTLVLLLLLTNVAQAPPGAVVALVDL